MARRSLVLTSEGARHWFRRSLPPRALQPVLLPEPEVLAAQARRADLKLFAQSWCAGVIGFGLFFG